MLTMFCFWSRHLLVQLLKVSYFVTKSSFVLYTAFKGYHWEWRAEMKIGNGTIGVGTFVHAIADKEEPWR